MPSASRRAAFTVGWRCTAPVAGMRSRRSGFGASAQTAARDLQWVYRTVTGKPAAVGLPVCIVDARDDRQIDCQALWGTPEPGVGGSIARAIGFDLSEAAVAGLSAGWFTG